MTYILDAEIAKLLQKQDSINKQKLGHFSSAHEPAWKQQQSM